MIGRERPTAGPATPKGGTAEPLGVAGLLYDAALDPEQWSAALAALARAMAAPAALLRAGSGDRRTTGVLATAGLEPAAVLACSSIDPMADPLCEAAERRLGAPVITGREVAVETVADSEFGRLVLQPAGLRHALGAALQAGEGVFVSLWFFRPASRPFQVADGARLAAWLPHVARAVTVQHRLSRAEDASAASVAAFDRLALGAVMVDERARPIIVNRLAERILAAGDGVRVTSGALCADSHAATARLHAAIRDTTREAAATGRTRSAGLRLARARRAAPLDVIVVSLAGPRWGASSGGPAAVVFIADPERTHVTPERLLRDLYGLTPAEARLAVRLAHGRSLTAAAADVGVSRNTAHTQLSSIYAKTGATTQPELVRLLHRGPAAIRPYEDSSDVQAPVDPAKGKNKKVRT